MPNGCEILTAAGGICGLFAIALVRSAGSPVYSICAGCYDEISRFPRFEVIAWLDPETAERAKPPLCQCGHRWKGHEVGIAVGLICLYPGCQCTEFVPARAAAASQLSPVW